MIQLEHIEAIEKRLWKAADTLRSSSNYASNEYFLPVMGLLFLRHPYWLTERFPDHEHAPVADSMPEGSEEKTIGEVCEAVEGGTPSAKISKCWDGNITWVALTDVVKNNFLILLGSGHPFTLLNYKIGMLK